MPPKGPLMAASPHAPAAAAVRMAAETMGEAGSRDALARLNEAVQELKALAVEPFLNRAVAALQQEDHKTGGRFALKALEQDERCGFAWYLLAIARERAGDFPSSVAAYEAALQLLPDHAEVANDLGRLAYRMGMRSQAEKLFRHYLARFPDNPEGANNLACAIRAQGSLDEAVAILKPAILKRPDVPMLWNTLGTVLAEQGDFATAQIFFDEALKLDPRFAKARYNLGNARLFQGDAEGALADCEAALAETLTADERQMMRLARSTILIALGRVAEGWDEYEARLHPEFGDLTHFLIDRPRWAPGAELSGRRLLVVGEQGLGDEILFGSVLPDVLERLGPDGRLSLAVEQRLAPLFARSFPQAEVTAHGTGALAGRPARFAPELGDAAGVDLWAPMGSLLREFRSGLDAFPDRAGYLRADPSRAAHWRGVLSTTAGRKVGLLWKSGVSANARHRFFAQFADWAPVLAQQGITFVNLQYGDCADELELARREFGVEILQPAGIDLKQDLDEVAALSCALDLVLGFSNATFNIAAACGAPAWLITTPGAWPRLGTEDRYPWYPQVRVFAPAAYGAWGAVMGEVAAALQSFAVGSER